MKKLVLLIILISAFQVSVFSQVETVAKEILTAYKNKDAELLKKNASGMIKMAISESYFNDASLQEDLKSLENWNGEIKEIRYETGDMMGHKIIMATTYYADVPGGDDIYTVIMSSNDGKKWIMFANGLSRMTKAEFDALSKEINSTEAKTETKPAKEYSVEMANGDTFDNVSFEKVTQCFDKLDDDNFFIIMSSSDDYIQAAYSDQGYWVEYSESGEHYVASENISKEKAIDLFKKYFQGSDDWKTMLNWEKD